jgi:hypothetical protein
MFQAVVEAIQDYILNSPPLGADINAQLKALQDKLTYNSNQFFELADTITFGADQQYFDKATQATTVINANLQKIATTDKWIAFAAAVVSLGESILTVNGGGIVSSVSTILGTFNITP